MKNKSNEVISNHRRRSHSRHSISSSSEMIHSPNATYISGAEDLAPNRRRSSSRSSASASPVPLHYQGRRSSSTASLTDSLTSSNCNNNGNSFSSCGAIPLTKNVGVSVNFGKSNIKSNSSSSSSAGPQHILPTGQQQQQRTSESSTSTESHNGRSDNSNNNNDSNNATSINLGHGHIGTIAGPPSVSISSGVGNSSSSIGVNHNSSLSTSPAVNAPTTCANKGVPSSHNNQEQHLNIPSPQQQQQSTQMSPHSPTLHTNDGTPDEPELVSEDGSKNGNSSSTSTSSSRNGGSSNNKCSNGGVQAGPISPTSSISSSCSGGVKGESQTNDASAKASTSSTGSTSSSSNGSANRIVSQNVNGTLAITGVPKNESELQLFRVLQRANLLSYFDVMIELGGDDVQQLCDAGEEEFLEIMALIGMASKPLHVRRLQKALQEWMTQPSLFQAPVLPPGYPGSTNPQLQALPHLATGQLPMPPHLLPFPSLPGMPLLHPGAAGLIPTPTPTPPFSDLKGSKIANSIQSNGLHQVAASQSGSSNTGTSPLPDLSVAAAAQAVSPHLAAMLSHLSSNNNQSQQQHQSRYNQHHTNSSHPHSNAHHPSHKNGSHITGIEKSRGNGGSGSFPLSLSDVKIPADQIIPSNFLETRIRTRSEASSPASSFPGSPHPESRNSVSPVPSSLQEHEVQKLADSAIRLIRSLPPSVAEPKFSSKRKTSGDYELIVRLSEADPRRMDEVRRVAAVYGRADTKRKTHKPLSMHELAINEAAAQLCKHVPALLTKRDELLQLSRQVLRDSGLPYAAVSSTFSISILTNNLLNNNASSSTPQNNTNNNNNDINTKSKYEESNGIGRYPSSTHFLKESASSSSDANYNNFGGFHSKRFRLDGASPGIEIQEYNRGCPASMHGNSPSPPTNNNGMQITELRNLPSRRSPSDEDSLPTPLELVTVTTSDLRKNGSSKSSSMSSVESCSPPNRKSVSVEPDDLNGNWNRHHPHQVHGVRVSQGLSHVPSAKVASIPVSGGSISIINHNENVSSVNSTNNHPYSHHFNYKYNGNPNGIHVLPIKSEPTVN